MLCKDEIMLKYLKKQDFRIIQLLGLVQLHLRLGQLNVQKQFSKMKSSMRSSLNLQMLRGDSLIWSSSKSIGQELMVQSSNVISKEWNEKIGDRQIKQSSNQQKQQSLKKQSSHNQMHSFIALDYGSLGQFITGVNLKTDLLKLKKKKNDTKDDVEQKKIKAHLINKNLDHILISPQSSFQEKNIASKLLIHKSFQEAFGSSITDFQQEQSRRFELQEKKTSLNINSLSDALDEIVNKSIQKYEDNPNNPSNLIEQNIRKNRSSIKDRSYFVDKKEKLLKKINDIKNTYRSLQKNFIPHQPTLQYSKLHQKSKSNSQHLNSFQKQSQDRDFSSSHNHTLLSNASEFKVFVLNQRSFAIHNFDGISTETVLYSISNLDFDYLQEVSIIKSSFTNSDSFYLLLDILAMEAKHLKTLVIQESFKMIQNKNQHLFSLKIKSIIETTSSSLQVLKLNRLGLETQDFCVICLGIGSTQKLSTAQLKYNKIDHHGQKSFDVINKFFKQIQFNISGNPLQNEMTKSKFRCPKVNLKQKFKELN